MKTNKSIRCSVDDCMYNDADNSYCTLEDINVTYDEDMELDAVCSNFEPADDVDNSDEEEEEGLDDEMKDPGSEADDI